MAKNCSRREFIKMLGLGTAAAVLPGSICGAAKLFSSKAAEVKLNVKLNIPPADAANIVYILCDDLGYGDVSCLNPTCRVTTPNIDRMASQGKLFTDSHTTSAVCTPTRYGILTGRYNWRSSLKSGVLYGYSMPLIEQGRQTVASYLKQNGYKTACIGKWHLGFDWQVKQGYTKDTSSGTNGNWCDFSKPFLNGPTTKGFDYYFGIAASLDMPPYAYLENDRTTEIPTITTSEFGRTGLKAPGFKGNEVLQNLRAKAENWITNHKNEPFFLYMPLNAPHMPHMPSAAFVGKSGVSKFYDYVLEVDDVIGKVMDAIDNNGLREKTVFIMTSDNGPEVVQGEYAGLYPKLAGGSNADQGEAYGYAGSSGPLRGRKRDSWDGGHRTPYIVRWPGKVAPGTRSSQIICTVDLFATCSNIIGNPIRPPDSMNILSAFLGTDNGVPVREATIHHSGSGKFSIRKGKWKYIDGQGANGGNAYNLNPNNVETGEPAKQLYDMEANLAENELQNRYPSDPDGVVPGLQALLNKYQTQGHSQPNGLPDFM
jgi:arylsulfatase A